MQAVSGVRRPLTLLSEMSTCSLLPGSFLTHGVKDVESREAFSLLLVRL